MLAGGLIELVPDPLALVLADHTFEGLRLKQQIVEIEARRALARDQVVLLAQQVVGALAAGHEHEVIDHEDRLLQLAVGTHPARPRQNVADHGRAGGVVVVFQSRTLAQLGRIVEAGARGAEQYRVDLGMPAQMLGLEITRVGLEVDPVVMIQAEDPVGIEVEVGRHIGRQASQQQDQDDAQISSVGLHIRTGSRGIRWAGCSTTPRSGRPGPRRRPKPDWAAKLASGAAGFRRGRCRWPARIRRRPA
ncbi:MAG: hypothetical protein BWY87_01616 [Deltaproteobacteria bacterium ADurb.Bin510]|nr:MAG: hypothetical protein BWY87_01616 [Deltaproteobacteria bacterium ADurb.Bin510]